MLIFCAIKSKSAKWTNKTLNVEGKLPFSLNSVTKNWRIKVAKIMKIGKFLFCFRRNEFIIKMKQRRLIKPLVIPIEEMYVII
jgi:hypothetical protein